MGAAVIGGVAAGLFPDFDVIHRFVRVDRTSTPNAANREVYSRLMPVFEKTYRSLVEVYDDLAALSGSGASLASGGVIHAGSCRH